MEHQAPCSDGARPSARVTVGDIARAHGAALGAEHALTPDQHQVLGCLERCRTAALGGHKYVCDTCGYTVPMYNSCRNRHCPTCQSLEQHRWLERRRETILPVAYFHLVFTLPSEQRTLVAMNRERMFAVLFEAASKTVLTLSRDNKRLGGTPAVTSVLHTWTRDLRFHPHIHAIVSAGAMNEQGQWVESRKDYSFPVKVMARLFRRFVREAVLDAIDNDERSRRSPATSATRSAPSWCAASTPSPTIACCATRTIAGADRIHRARPGRRGSSTRTFQRREIFELTSTQVALSARFERTSAFVLRSSPSP